MKLFSRTIWQRRQCAAAAAICLFGLTLSGCAEHKIGADLSAAAARPQSQAIAQEGDTVSLRYLCRLQNGDLAASTDAAAGQAKDARKSALYLAPEKDGPVTLVTTSVLPASPAKGGEWSFEEEIAKRLAVFVNGMRSGETRTVLLTAEQLPQRREEEYVISMARVRMRPRELRIPLAQYIAQKNETPEVGQSFVIDRVIPGTITSLTEDEVVVTFTLKNGDVIETPFGPGRVKEKDSSYEITIETQPGAVVRTAHLAGRIAAADDQNLTIDYRHPFGGESLTCNVTVDAVRKKAALSAAVGE
jgi:FKBP-type peptidyl-prolyl cis-trans isomerase 2